MPDCYPSFSGKAGMCMCDTEPVPYILQRAFYLHWARLRWSGWVVGEFHVTQATTAEFLLSGVRQFFVDDIDSMHVGDPYGQGLARVTVPLSSGRHTLFLPIYGSADRPLEIHVEMTSIAEGNVLRYMPDDVLLPDAVDGRLASPYVSVVVQNSGQLPLVNLTAILRSGEQEANVIVTALPAIAPGQILPLVLFADTGYDYRQAGNCSDQLRVVIRSRDDDRLLLATSLSIRCKQFGDAYRFTFLDFDGSVQKAAARPPPEPCTAYGNTTVDGCPVLFTTHGAGVEADGDAWVGAYRPQRHAWILFPSNRRSYGYDWEGPGMTPRVLEHRPFELIAITTQA